MEKQDYIELANEVRDALNATDRRLLPSEKKALKYMAQECAALAPKASFAGILSIVAAVLFTIVGATPFAIIAVAISGLSFVMASGADKRFHKIMARLHSEILDESQDLFNSAMAEITKAKEGKK